MIAGCEAVDIFLDRESGQCGRPATPYRRICVHEHVRDGALCRGHAGNVAAGICRKCQDHPTDPHECGIHLQPLAGGS